MKARRFIACCRFTSGRLWRLAMVVVVTLHAAAPCVWAQKPARIADEGGGALPFGVALGIAVIVCAAAFVNPKRSHLN